MADVVVSPETPALMISTSKRLLKLRRKSGRSRQVVASRETIAEGDELEFALSRHSRPPSGCGQKSQADCRKKATPRLYGSLAAPIWDFHLCHRKGISA
jgi:hypothetical protein